jgi:proteasome accessory factor B
VQPLALVEYEARWHVFGRDIDAAGDRMFLLTRIVGDVTVTSEAFPAELREGAGERALASLQAVAAAHSALLEVTPGTEAALRLGRRAEPAVQGIRVPYVDLHILADELASYGPEVRVVEPALLREAVIARLKATASAHAESKGGE